MKMSSSVPVIEIALASSILACRPAPRGTAMEAHIPSTVAPTAEVLALNEGERRVRRGTDFPFILKVDGQNGGSRDLVMGYEDVPAGHTIAPHRHLIADEIIFVHAGAGVAEVGDQKTEPAPPMSTEERAAIRARHQWHVANEQP